MKPKSGKAWKSHEDADISSENPFLDLDQACSDAGLQYNRHDEWLLRFEVNDMGIGRILLPPTLSTLLQSDKISIVPSAGGLFIRSVTDS
jgi:hypothetical protein